MLQKKSKAKVQPEPDNWIVAEHMVVNGRHVTPGTEVSIVGMRGRYRFIRRVQVTGEDGKVEREWIDVVGGGTRTRPDMLRSFRPERVKTVHRVNKTRANAS